MHLLHRHTGASLTQHGPAPGAAAHAAVARLALAGQFGQLFHAGVDQADLIPGGAAHHAVHRQAKLPLKTLYGLLHGCTEHTIHRQCAKAGVILGNAIQLPLQNGHIGAAVPHPQAAAGIALLHGGNILRAADSNIRAVVMAQDLQRVVSAVGQLHRAPLLHAGAAHAFSVAIFGVIGLGVAALLHIGVENFACQALHHLEYRAFVYKILVIACGIGDVKIIAAAAVPLGVNAVQRQTDLCVYVGPQRIFGPCGIHLAAGHICNIVLETHGNISRRSRRAAQMHRDGFGDHHLPQDHGLSAGGFRGRAAAAAAFKQRSARGCGHLRVFAAAGQHFQLRQRGLPIEDLNII